MKTIFPVMFALSLFSLAGGLRDAAGRTADHLGHSRLAALGRSGCDRRGRDKSPEVVRSVVAIFPQSVDE